jgi:hypothetical protein
MGTAPDFPSLQTGGGQECKAWPGFFFLMKGLTGVQELDKPTESGSFSCCNVWEEGGGFLQCKLGDIEKMRRVLSQKLLFLDAESLGWNADTKKLCC